MSPILIGLIVVVVIIILVYILLGTTSTSNKNISLLTTPTTVLLDDSQNKSSVNYTYVFWINIHSWINNDTKSILTFSESATDTSNPKFKVYLDPNDSNMYCDILTNEGVKKILITSAFPLQRWTQVLISVEDRNVDCYVNGKMTNAVLLTSPQSQITNADSKPAIIVGGNKSFDAYIQKLARATYAVDPYTVWTNYVMDYIFVSAEPITKSVKVALLESETVKYEATII